MPDINVDSRKNVADFVNLYFLQQDFNMTFNSEILILWFQTETKEPKDNKEVSSPDDLELELENLEINDDTLELEGGDEAEDLTKKLLDEQEQEDEEASTGSHLKLIVDAFLQQLPNCVNRDLIDKVWVPLCDFTQSM